VRYVLVLMALAWLAACCACLRPARGQQPARCPMGCSKQCTCGCNKGEPCVCAAYDAQGRRIDPPAPAAAKADVPNYGVETDKIGTGRCWRRGREISREEAAEAVENKQLPDDAAKLRLTVIGQEADRKRVLADLDSSPELAAYKGRLVVQAYPPDHWAIKDAGFAAGGSPTVYLQRPDGKVLHRQDAYPSAEKLALALRKAEPTYDPKKDPDLSRPALPGGFDPSKVPPLAWGGAGLLLLLLAQSKKGT
jgi:hypothetical protein